MRRENPRPPWMAIGIVVLLIGGFATGAALRSNDSESEPAAAAGVSSTQPEPEASADGDTLRPVGTDGTEPADRKAVSGVAVSGIALLQEFHDNLVQAGGSIIQGNLVDAKAEGVLVLGSPEIMWTADADNARSQIGDGRLTATFPEGVDVSSLDTDVRGVAFTLAAVTGEGELMTYAHVAADGSFVPLTLPGELSNNALAIGGDELFRVQYLPPPANLCETGQPVNYESPSDAVTTYLETLGTRTELAIERGNGAAMSEADAIFADAPAFADPVTGFVVSASLSDIVSQLEAGKSDDAVLRAAIPVEIDLMSAELAEKSAGLAMVFIDIKRSQVLGWFSLGTQIGDPTTNETFNTAILEIAPPLNGSDVAVVVRPETLKDTSCGLIGATEDQLTIPHDDIAGKTRVSISLEKNTYLTVTDFELND